MAAGRQRSARRLADRRQHVDTTDGCVAGCARLGVSGPTDDSRHADATLVEMAFLGPERTTGSVGMISGDGRPVVAGEQYQRVIGQLLPVDSRQQPPKGVIHLGDVGVVPDLGRIVQIGVPPLEDLG